MYLYVRSFALFDSKLTLLAIIPIYYVLEIICWLYICICAVNLLAAQMWIKPVTFIQKCNIGIVKIDNTIFYQINIICKQKSLMSKKYSHSWSSCTNVNNLSGKHIIEYSTPNSDSFYQFTFLMIKGTIQRGNPKQKSAFDQFNKILHKCK